METTYELPGSLASDIERLRAEVERFEKGETSAAEFRSFRVPMGIYEQREPGTYMLRIRLPAGAVLPAQMRVLAAVSRRYGSGVLHVTTRQDIQVHRIPLRAIHPVILDLYNAGLSTKGGGGNTVRNVTACWASGICPREVFDVAPYAIAITEALLSDPKSYVLPRKFKVAFSGCPKDCAATALNDLGFVAHEREGRRGFAVYAGGGLGAHARVGKILEEFVPAEEVHLVAEAVKRVFDAHGNRRDRHRARLRFLVEQVGFDRFRSLYEAALGEVRRAPSPSPAIRDLSVRVHRSSVEAEEPLHGFSEWRRRNVFSQKQAGLWSVHVPLHLGDIEAKVFVRLAAIVEVHGDGLARTTQWQNFLLTGLEAEELPGLHRALQPLGLAAFPPSVLRNVVACAGASTCKLGICLSRGLAKAVAEEVEESGQDLDGLGDIAIHVSGCPNACGRHPVADIGFFGAARRVGDRLVPHYVVQLGGKTHEGTTRLAEGKDIVPARNIPAFTVEFIRAFRSSPEFPDFTAFLKAGGREVALALAIQHHESPVSDRDPMFHLDWGTIAPFSLAGRGPGECGAGVFDLIEVDLSSAREALGDGRLHAAVVLAARALLITRGHEAKSAEEALDLFDREFIASGLIEPSFRPLLDRARQVAGSPQPERDFQEADPKAVKDLVDAVEDLYGRLDQSLKSVQPALVSPAGGEDHDRLPKADREVDFHAVACPLNFVKTKILLATMSSGQVLSVVLSAEGKEKVPASVRAEGHQVIAVEPHGPHWRVLIRKG